MQCTFAKPSSAVSPALQCLSTLSHKWNNFFFLGGGGGGGVIAHKMCVFFPTMFEAFCILRRNERDVI